MCDTQQLHLRMTGEVACIVVPLAEVERLRSSANTRFGFVACVHSSSAFIGQLLTQVVRSKAGCTIMLLVVRHLLSLSNEKRCFMQDES